MKKKPAPVVENAAKSKLEEPQLPWWKTSLFAILACFVVFFLVTGITFTCDEIIFRSTAVHKLYYSLMKTPTYEETLQIVRDLSEHRRQRCPMVRIIKPVPAKPNPLMDRLLLNASPVRYREYTGQGN